MSAYLFKSREENVQAFPKSFCCIDASVDNFLFVFDWEISLIFLFLYFYHQVIWQIFGDKELTISSLFEIDFGIFSLGVKQSHRMFHLSWHVYILLTDFIIVFWFLLCSFSYILSVTHIQTLFLLFLFSYSVW